MQTLSLIWGVLALLGMLIALTPCLGALNWINIPFSVLGLIISIIAFATAGGKATGGSTAGIICCVIALVVGGIRLILGGGVL
ncbi:MAG: hypothetical protein JSV79_08450 [Armatimonadota bacterium]|nr:MAG: hypothetical protein JSV79_08450 [Armatimonadota bacterium]